MKVRKCEPCTDVKEKSFRQSKTIPNGCETGISLENYKKSKVKGMYPELKTARENLGRARSCRALQAIVRSVDFI